MLAILSDPNVQWVLAGTLLLGASSGVIGTFALLRGRSLLGDVLAHAALPGICVAFLVSESKDILALIIGAAVAGLIGVRAIDAITQFTRIKEDTALGIVLTVFFGFGVTLLTMIQHSGAGSQAGLDSFLFGQAAALVGRDVLVMAVVAVVVLAVTALFYKEFKLLCFDRSFGAGIGFPMRSIDAVLMSLIVAAVVIGLQAVGVILMASLLITPAVAARYLTERLGWMVTLAALIGGVAGAGGTLLSTLAPRLSTGPLIVLCASALFLLSFVLAPGRGLLAKFLRFLRLRRRVARENFLREIYERYEVAVTNPLVADPKTLERGVLLGGGGPAAGGDRSRPVPRIARALEREGLLRLDPEGDGAYRCTLTQAGLTAAWEIVRKHRLWETFLMHEAELGADHVDRDADDIEHFLTPELVQALEALLKKHGLEPKLIPSAHPLPSEAQDGS